MMTENERALLRVILETSRTLNGKFAMIGRLMEDGYFALIDEYEPVERALRDIGYGILGGWLDERFTDYCSGKIATTDELLDAIDGYVETLMAYNTE